MNVKMSKTMNIRNNLLFILQREHTIQNNFKLKILYGKYHI